MGCTESAISEMPEADRVGVFLASWQQLSNNDKTKGLAAFAKQPQVQAAKHEPKATTECPTTVYGGILFHSYYSYFYYYPTMNWSLDKTPETDDYWVGIYKKAEEDNTKYLAYQYVNKAAQGSYYIGQLNTTAGDQSVTRSDEFELRIFKGSYQRLDAATNILRGTIVNGPTNPSSPSASTLVADVESKQLDAETREFIRAIDTAKTGAFPGQSSLEDLRKLWDSFTRHQQQLLFPILEQDSLPDEIKKPGAKALDCPEPKVRFPSLGKTDGLKAADDPVADPNKIVLTITLNQSNSYVYTMVTILSAVPTDYARMGMYFTQSDMCYNPNSCINNQWLLVGNGQEGGHKLPGYIQQDRTGPTSKRYVGAIFDWSEPDKAYVQIGLAARIIGAAISATPALPPAVFEPDFDKDEALRYAKLSQLAYEPYSVVQQQLADYNLVAEMQIYDPSTDTNGFIASDDDSIVVAFRGTVLTSWANILTDAWVVRMLIDPDGQSFAHKGFLTAFNAVYASIETKLKPYLGTKELFITGHSLGGALATLLTYRISRAYANSQPTQYVYGCPPVGDINFATYFRGMESNTITIQNDPVSSGKLIWLFEVDGFFKPYQVKYLPQAGGHGIADYIQQLENLP